MPQVYGSLVEDMQAVNETGERTTILGKRVVLTGQLVPTSATPSILASLVHLVHQEKTREGLTIRLKGSAARLTLRWGSAWARGRTRLSQTVSTEGWS